MAICIRQANVRDSEAIRRFIFEAYGKFARFKDARRWNWQFIANPSTTPSLSDEVSVWIAEEDGRVVGQIAVQSALIQTDGAEHPGGWIVDVMILPAYRGRTLGHQLYAAAASEFRMLITLTMAPATRRMALKAGCITLGGVQQFTKIIHLSDATARRYLLGRTAHRPLIHHLARIACTVFRLDVLGSKTLNKLFSIKATSNRLSSARSDAPEIVEVEFFGRELDHFWEQARHEYPALASRNARFLNWRYVEAPDLRYRRFLLLRGGSCVGYIVIRSSTGVELPAGIIVDFLTFRNDLEVITCMLEHAAGALENENEFLVCATSVPEIGTVLKQLGFFQTNTEHPTVVCRDPLVHRQIEALKGQWFLTKGDQDWDQIFVY